MLTSQLMPTLYTSSFDADSALREPPPRTADKVIVGFREQTAAVAAVGITALLERVALEGTSTVIEGAHVVPGFITDGLGLLLLLPPVRALVRARLRRRFRVQVAASRPGARRRPGPIDVEGGPARPSDWDPPGLRG